jgi:hypothetical protein
MQDQLFDHHKYPFEEFPPRRPTPSKEQLEQQEQYLYWLDRLADPTTPLLYDYPNIRHRPTKASPVPPPRPSTPSTKTRVSNRLASKVPRPPLPLPQPSAPVTRVSLKRPVRSPPLPKRKRPVTLEVKEEKPIDKSSWICKYCGSVMKTQPSHYTFSIKRHLFDSKKHTEISADTIWRDYGGVLNMILQQVRAARK